MLSFVAFVDVFLTAGVVVLVIAIVFCQNGFDVDFILLTLFHHAVEASTVFSVVSPSTVTLPSLNVKELKGTYVLVLRSVELL